MSRKTHGTSNSDRLNVCVFCASSNHLDDVYLESARKLGRYLASAGHVLVYGGGNNGLMGAMSQSMHDAGGYVIGVITGHLKEMGYAYTGADEMIVTGTMRQRKDRMEKIADAFIALPGGFGTLEEVLEIITLRQLGLHSKPVVLLNIRDFFSHLLEQFETGYNERFMHETDRGLYYVTKDPNDAVSYINTAVQDVPGRTESQ